MFEPTGEVRTPRTGELYLSTDGRMEVATFDFSQIIAPIFRRTSNDNKRHIKRKKERVYT